MQILGKLRDDIEKGNAVLRLGAGVGMAAGLFGGEALAEYLHRKAALEKLAARAKSLPKLVSALDKEPQYTRTWVNEQLVHYFSDRSHYTNLELIERLLRAAEWKAIFTTNFDLALELAYSQCESLPGGRRLVSISDPRETDLISSAQPRRLKYFKLHGCVDALEKNPSRQVPLVLTRKDFTDSIERNTPFWKELKDNAYGASVIFLGFNVQRPENAIILGSVIGVYEAAVQLIHDTFKPFAVLPAISSEAREDLEELDINLLEGDLKEFLDAIKAGIASSSDETSPLQLSKEETITYEYWDGVSNFSRAELDEMGTQFDCYHSDFLISHQRKFNALSDSERSEAWKSRPSLTFLYGGRTIRRDCFQKSYTTLLGEVKKAAQTGFSRVVFIEGERAAGKSVLAHKLAEAYYRETRNHVLLLNPMSSFIEARDDGSEGNISGWNGRL